MKNFLLLSLLSLFGTMLKAQVTRIDTLSRVTDINKANVKYAYTPEYLYTIAVRAFGLDQFPQILDQSANERLFSSAFNGLQFKINDNQISYRLSGSHFGKEVEFSEACTDCEFFKGKLQNTTLKIGFEKNIIYGRIQPYFGIDLGFSHQKYTAYLNENDAAESNAMFGAVDRANSGLLSPFIGLKVNIVPNISIAAESSVTMAYTRQTTERPGQQIMFASQRVNFDENSRNRWEYFFSPVGFLTLQFHFGSLY